MQQFSYPVTLKRDKSGGYVVTFRDIPEAITQGENRADALGQAEDALDEAVAGRMRLGDEIPLPSKSNRSSPLVSLPAATALKAALYLTIKEAQLSKVALATQLGYDEKEVRRLLNPDHASKLKRIEDVLKSLGKRIVVSIEDRVDVKRPAHARSANR